MRIRVVEARLCRDVPTHVVAQFPLRTIETISETEKNFRSKYNSSKKSIEKQSFWAVEFPLL